MASDRAEIPIRVNSAAATAHLARIAAAPRALEAACAAPVALDVEVGGAKPAPPRGLRARLRAWRRRGR